MTTPRISKFEDKEKKEIYFHSFNLEKASMIKKKKIYALLRKTKYTHL